MMIRQNELDMIARISAGETSLFGELVAPYRERLFAVILRVVKDPSDADDLVQDTLLRVYRALTTFRGDACFYTWMFRIATNCALAFLSRKKRLGQSHGEVDPDHDSADREVSEDHDPENVLLLKQLAAAMDAALDSMEPKYRTAVVLHGIEGLSYQEIADEMCCPVGTVRSRIFSARSAIAGKLKQRGFPSAAA